ESVALRSTRFRMFDAVAAVTHCFLELLAGLSYLIDSCQIRCMLEFLVHPEGDGKVEGTDDRTIDSVNADNRFNIVDRLLRFDNRDTGERVVSLAKVLVRIEAINAGSTRPVTADSRRRITAGLDQRAGFFSGIDERTQDTLRPQIQKTPDLVLVEAPWSSEDHGLCVRRRLTHRAPANAVVSRVPRIVRQPASS